MSRVSSARHFGSIAVRTPVVVPGQRIGIMGGTFNPPHAGHAYVARAAIQRLRLDWLWWLVTPGNPLKRDAGLPPLEARMAACRVLAHDPRIRVAGFEATLGSAYTADTLAFLVERHPGARFVWVMGADGLGNFHRWHRWRDIARAMPIAVLDRPGERFAAMASPAAHALARAFVPERRAGGLAMLAPPSWTFLTTRRLPISSTEMRGRAADPATTDG